ncbi:hypothetical protein AYI68_g7381 [Smittium mucronatum]|uniref:Uncharacterized protein n=1 Tax=Smittium mucronatum TaxID=133383 RepID=A0A1R0GNW2_9FUNG|nr:hypothetical protein AYI68_g7381 [Smittium mucronatum]
MTLKTTGEPSNRASGTTSGVFQKAQRLIKIKMSRSATEWESLLLTDCEYFPECDNIVRWSDITSALSDTQNNKAPGDDGVPSDVWKLEVSEKIPESKILKIIFKIVKLIDSAEKR